MNRAIIFSIIFLAQQIVAAPSGTSFDLIKYVPPEFNYHNLELRPRLFLDAWSESSAQTIDAWDVNSPAYNSDARYGSKGAGFGLDVHHSYYGWRGPVEWQLAEYLYTNGNIGHSEPNTEDRDAFHASRRSFNRNGSGQCSFSVAASYYFRWPFFVGAIINPDFSGSSYRRHSDEKSYLDPGDPDSVLLNNETFVSTQRGYRAGGMAGINIGAGHIDDISFVIAALNMTDRMAKVEKTYKGYTAQEIQQFAALIEKMRKRRFFDSRIAFMENIDTLCGFIKRSGIAGELSPHTVLEIADQWNYVFYQQRKKGTSILIRPFTRYSRNFNRIESTSDLYKRMTPIPFDLDDAHLDSEEDHVGSSYFHDGERTTDLTGGLQLHGIWERPLSQFFQLSLRLETEAKALRRSSTSWMSRESISSDYRYIQPQLSVTERSELNYYPDTRTAIGISASIFYNRLFNYHDLYRSVSDASELPVGNEFKMHDVRLSLSGNAAYYFTPRLQIHVNAGVTYDKRDNRQFGLVPERDYRFNSLNRESLNFSLNADVTWSLF